MKFNLNNEQTKSLANYLFDVAKGLTLGSIAFATVAPYELKLIYVVLSLIIAFWLIKIALSLMEDLR